EEAPMPHTYHRYKPGSVPVPGYHLLDMLGEGGFGEVWKARGPGGAEAALKIIDLSGKQGLQEFGSLRLVKNTHHPNLIELQAFWLKDQHGNVLDDRDEYWAKTPSK